MDDVLTEIAREIREMKWTVASVDGFEMFKGQGVRWRVSLITSGGHRGATATFGPSTIMRLPDELAEAAQKAATVAIRNAKPCSICGEALGARRHWATTCSNFCPFLET